METELFCIKLVSGETIMGVLTERENQTDTLLISSPLQIQEMYNQNSTYLYLTEWLHASSDNNFIIRKSSLIGLYKPNEALIGHYQNMLTKLLAKKLNSLFGSEQTSDEPQEEQQPIKPVVLKSKTIH